MILSKIQTYFLSISLVLGALLVYQTVWLFSKTTPGHIESFGKGSGKREKHIEHVTVRYHVDQIEYIEKYLRNGHPENEHTIQIRYLLFSPSISRIDSFEGNWGLAIVIISVLVPIITICFLVKEVVPMRSEFLLSKSFPFLRRLPARTK